MRGARSRRIISFIVGILAVAIVAFLAVGLIFEDSWPGQLLRGTAVQTGGAQPGYIPPKSAVNVDGNAAEWSGDAVFANMYRAGKLNKPVEAYLYLRFKCPDTMYVLVLSAGDWPVDTAGGTGEAWVRINGNKVSLNEFAWVDEGYDGQGGHAKGWEASFTLQQGDYSIQAHTNTYHDGESQTADSTSVGLSVVCAGTTAVTLVDFTAQWADSAGSKGSRSSLSLDRQIGVILRWETASEIDNLGFNVYRATRKRGPWKMLNRQLIPSNVPPGSPVGSQYEWNDATARPNRRYFYMLEDVDVNGTSTKHGPVQP